MIFGFAGDPAMLALALVGGHAVGDFGIQTLYISQAKTRHGEKADPHWFPVLFAHAAIHGLIVGLATGYAWLGWAEIALHFIIDDRKCANKFGYNADQALHYGCKLLWFVVALALYNHVI